LGHHRAIEAPRRHRQAGELVLLPGASRRQYSTIAFRAQQEAVSDAIRGSRGGRHLSMLRAIAAFYPLQLGVGEWDVRFGGAAPFD
jgi:hypothetical protein